MQEQDHIKALREAVTLSPGNMPLRRALAEALLALKQGDIAEKELRSALQLDPDNGDLKILLARAFMDQDKLSAGIVLLEDLVKSPRPPAQANALLAKAYLRSGEVEKAVRQYKKSVEQDPPVVDPELASALGVRPAAAGEAEYPDSSEEVVDGKRRQREGEEDRAIPSIERSKVTFADVGGLDSLKEEIRMKIIHPLNNAALFEAYGKKIGGGILLYGPPGCGKTHMARATAGEIQAGFLSIGINDILDMWIGSSEKKLHEVFEQARENKPCVLFFDEVDALAASRTDMRTSGGRHMINQFLAELDGIQSNNDGLLILAATNAPWHVDPAFRRPGRFDRILFVPPPDQVARGAILTALLRGKPQKDVDADAVARKTDGFSGADLKNVVDMTIEAKLSEAMKTGVPSPITTKDLLAVAGRTGPSTKEWFSTARNYALYANQGGAYDDILKYLK